LIDKEKIHVITDKEIDENLDKDFTGQIIIIVNCRSGGICKVQSEIRKKREYQ
jgi:hypothetical protein